MSCSDSTTVLGASQARGSTLPIPQQKWWYSLAEQGIDRLSLAGQKMDKPPQAAVRLRMLSVGTPTKLNTQESCGGQEGVTKGNKMQTKEEKPRLKRKGSITLEAPTWTCSCGCRSHICPSQALRTGLQPMCGAMLEPHVPIAWPGAFWGTSSASKTL